MPCSCTSRCRTFIWNSRSFKGRDTAEVFEEAPVVAEGSFHSQHEPHLPIEPDVMQAYWGTDGMMTIQCKSQSLTENIDVISLACDIPKENIRIIMNPVGGSFGYSTSPNTFALITTAVQNLDMPCYADAQLRGIQPHDRQALGVVHERPHRLRQGRQDPRRGIRHRARPRRVRRRREPDLQQPRVRRLPRLTTSRTSRRSPAAARRIMPLTPPTAASARRRSTRRRKRSSIWPPRRSAWTHGSSAIQERRAPRRPDDQQLSVPRLRLPRHARKGQTVLRRVQGGRRKGEGRGPSRRRRHELWAASSSRSACSTRPRSRSK